MSNSATNRTNQFRPLYKNHDTQDSQFHEFKNFNDSQTRTRQNFKYSKRPSKSYENISQQNDSEEEFSTTIKKQQQNRTFKNKQNLQNLLKNQQLAKLQSNFTTQNKQSGKRRQIYQNSKPVVMNLFQQFKKNSFQNNETPNNISIYSNKEKYKKPAHEQQNVIKLMKVPDAKNGNSQSKVSINFTENQDDSDQNNLHFQFGNGLERISPKKHDQNNSKLPQLIAFFSNNKNKNIQNDNMTPNTLSQKCEQNLHRQSSVFSPLPSGMSQNKRRISRKINEIQKKQTGRNFYKRPSSASFSQEYLKSIRNQKESKSKKLLYPNNQLAKHPQQKYNTFKNQIVFSNTTNDRNSIGHNQSPITRQLAATHNELMGARQNLQLTLANNLTRILFKYNGGHATTLYNYRLKIKNQSLVKMIVKIKCTNPKHYDIRPKTTIKLQPSEISQITIEMKLYPHDLNPISMKHDLTRYKNDKFKISYQIDQTHTDIQYLPGQKILPVMIQQTQEERIRNQGITKQTQNQKSKLKKQQKQIVMYKKLNQKNIEKIKFLDQNIQNLQKQQFYLKYLTKGLFLIVMGIGTTLGFFIG